MEQCLASIPSTILSPDGPPVGVRYFPATKNHAPFRVFYPAHNKTEEGPYWTVSWFQDTGFFAFLDGYVRMAMGRNAFETAIRRWLFWGMIRPLLVVLSLTWPMAYTTIPRVYQDAPCRQESYPIILFSHGLTGTGQENSLLCAAWAQRGFVVFNIHHTDGSSCRVTLPDGTIRYYHFGPPWDRYDPNFRPQQVLLRADQLIHMYRFVTKVKSETNVIVKKEDITSFTDSNSLNNNNNNSNSNSKQNFMDAGLVELQEIMDPSQGVIAAGFSYGASTVAQALVTEAQRNHQQQVPFTAAIFLDGWFRIDMQKSAGIAFRFPEPAFEQGLPSNVETMFLDSQEFANKPLLLGATKQLAGDDHDHETDDVGDTVVNGNTPTNTRSSKVVVVAGTCHQNFCDVVFWLARSPMWRRFLTKNKILGSADPIQAYEEIVQRTCTFLHLVRRKSTTSDKKNI